MEEDGAPTPASGLLDSGAGVLTRISGLQAGRRLGGRTGSTASGGWAGRSWDHPALQRMPLGQPHTPSQCWGLHQRPGSLPAPLRWLAPGAASWFQTRRCDACLDLQRTARLAGFTIRLWHRTSLERMIIRTLSHDVHLQTPMWQDTTDLTPARQVTPTGQCDSGYSSCCKAFWVYVRMSGKAPHHPPPPTRKASGGTFRLHHGDLGLAPRWADRPPRSAPGSGARSTSIGEHRLATAKPGVARRRTVSSTVRIRPDWRWGRAPRKRLYRHYRNRRIAHRALRQALLRLTLRTTPQTAFGAAARTQRDQTQAPGSADSCRSAPTGST